MRVPEQLRDATRFGAAVRTYEYDEGSEIVVDLGKTDEVTVDVVGDTAIVVVDGEQFEFDVPPSAGEVSVRNGVLTIRE